MAAEIVAAMRKDRFEIRVGRIKQLAVISRISRISPTLADSIAARATG
ncbi:MAG TPA: hypothetical protein VKB32_07765 [Actinomycetota bacterium]|nr:hypothetical protein [Actinomycetota bacterium]